MADIVCVNILGLEYTHPDLRDNYVRNITL